MKASQLAVAAAVAFAVLAPALQTGLNLGQSQEAFAYEGDSTLRAAGWAFSIWGVIYVGLIAYAIWQARRQTPFLAAVAWPSVVACVGCGAWIIASGADWRWATVGIILISALAMVLGLWRAPKPDRAQLGERLLAVWPLGLLAGWLTIASALNILTVMTAQDMIGPAAVAPAAYAGVVFALASAFMVVARTRIAGYGAAIAWGLVGVYAAEQTQKSAVAMTALVFAGLVAAWSAWTLLRRKGL